VAAAAGVGAAVLLAGAGFLAGTRFGGGHDVARLISDHEPGIGNRHGFGRGDGDGQGAFPRGRMPGDPDGDGAGPRGNGGRGAADIAPVTAGRITAINGSTLTLSTFRGGTATVTTTSSTTVAGVPGGNLSSLSVGQVVLVAGSTSSTGNYQASAIMLRPARGMHWGGGRP
jgi:hypothetical protein